MSIIFCSLMPILQPYFADEQKVPARAEVVMLMANAYAYAEQQGSPE